MVDSSSGPRTSDDDLVRREIWGMINEGRFDDARLACEKWSKNGSINARFFLGWLHQHGKGVRKDLDVAYELYKSAAALGIAEAQFYLGKLCLLKGDASEAIEWLERASSLEYPPAAYRLSMIYSEGKTVAIDLQKGDAYLHKAARLGHFFASKTIAVRLVKGTRVKRNVLKGVVMFISTFMIGLRGVIRDPYGAKAMYMDD